MSHPPLRFVHASDFHLESPLGGVSEVPPERRDLFLEAPFLAASQVFETVLAEGADALLLSGDLLDSELAGPRAVVFLRDHFQRLADHGIPVYWACGEVDAPDTWPACAKLPENVHIFPVGHVASYELLRDGKPVARIQGVSRTPGVAPDDSGFHCDALGLFTVGIAYGTAASPGAEGDRVDYMALGGQHHRQTVDQSPGIAHYCGTPQGRDPSEAGPRGCTVVLVDDAGQVKTNFVATDAVRWISEIVEITAGTDEDALMSQIEDRIAKLRTKHHGSELLITWEITGRGSVVNHIRSGGISDKMVDVLRRRYATQSPGAWTVGIECRAPLDVPQEWVDEETIMGDLLRDFRKLEADSDISLKLEEFLPAEYRDGSLADVAVVEPEDRAELLWAASKLGVDLMDGEEVLSRG
ncbi:metallophosphoesterase family protein [Bythopirellula polymerisocia]|uniref:Putative metallophosphoesterase YhaO n=1 Tax=Bythopirellula polymerisocia TaxID=2528003 RepID=A0A5C6CNS1_9BACT|nr:metallophosphoesterase [Bythopirellula polymerisocia]TWU26092.1 putative metallophosphoesterase YhaO [Bythopirellula polymerisocia]